MTIFLTILFILVIFLLITIVLLQQPKNAGGGVLGGSNQSLLGTSAKTFLTKFTMGLGAAFLLLSLALSALPRYRKPSSAAVEWIQKQEKKETAASAEPSTAPEEAAGRGAPVPGGAPHPQGVPAHPAGSAPQAPQAAP